jgi:hypothetical protein
MRPKFLGTIQETPKGKFDTSSYVCWNCCIGLAIETPVLYQSPIRDIRGMQNLEGSDDGSAHSPWVTGLFYCPEC